MADISAFAGHSGMYAQQLQVLHDVQRRTLQTTAYGVDRGGLKKLADIVPEARTLQLLSANPLCMTYDKLAPILEMINRYLPQMEYIYVATRVTDIRNKTAEQLKNLKKMCLREISLGEESDDDWTLDRIHKGYHA